MSSTFSWQNLFLFCEYILLRGLAYQNGCSKTCIYPWHSRLYLCEDICQFCTSSYASRSILLASHTPQACSPTPRLWFEAHQHFGYLWFCSRVISQIWLGIQGILVRFFDLHILRIWKLFLCYRYFGRLSIFLRNLKTIVQSLYLELEAVVKENFLVTFDLVALLKRQIIIICSN